MKELTILWLAATAFVSLSACTTVEQKREPSTHTTTSVTEQSTVRRPADAYSTTETRKVSAY